MQNDIYREPPSANTIWIRSIVRSKKFISVNVKEAYGRRSRIKTKFSLEKIF